MLLTNSKNIVSVEQINFASTFLGSSETLPQKFEVSALPFLGGELSFLANFFKIFHFFYCNLLVYSWNWWIKSLAKIIIGNCLFSVILFILAPIFALSTVFYLFPPPNTLLSFYYYQLFYVDLAAIHVLSICHQDMCK
jgi:hypothetical protein